jgi:arylsulfatase A-like enzyme
MHRRGFLGSLGAAAAALAPPQSARKPNIILILADDLGYGDLGCYGQQRIATPHLDRMAAEGVRFMQAYAGSTVCAPSRCCLMTGMHTGHARVRGNRFPDLHLRPEDVAIPELLKRAGYRTGAYGKWALGGIGTPGYTLNKGFDEWFGFFSQTHAHNYYPEHLLENDREFLMRGNMGAKKQDYASDLFTDRALKFIDSSANQTFFLYLAYTIPHANNELGRHTGNGMEVPSDAPYTGQSWPQPEKNFAAMITRMDGDIGRVMASLKEHDIDEETLVLFSSDNGPHREGGHDPDFFDSNGPLRGIKRDLYEGGIRVPALARWAGRIQPGRVSDHPWAFWDVLPTLAEVAGVQPPSGLDGLSALPAILGTPQKEHDYFYWEFHERAFKQAVRTGRWKGIRTGLDGPVELYDLDADIGEERNVAARHPSVVRRIQDLLRTSRTESPEWPVKPQS